MMPLFKARGATDLIRTGVCPEPSPCKSIPGFAGVKLAFVDWLNHGRRDGVSDKIGHSNCVYAREFFEAAIRLKRG
jgi:hypothetical protein